MCVNVFACYDDHRFVYLHSQNSQTLVTVLPLVGVIHGYRSRVHT